MGTEGASDDQARRAIQLQQQSSLRGRVAPGGPTHFIDRLTASGNDTRSAEEALEVMRDILRELYRPRSVAAQGRAPQRRSERAAAHQKNREQALAANSSALFAERRLTGFIGIALSDVAISVPTSNTTCSIQRRSQDRHEVHTASVCCSWL